MNATAAPPFKVPVPGLAISPGPWQALTVEPYTDGDVKHWPGKPTYVPSDERAYSVKIAKAWADHLGITEPGVNYYLTKFPTGYGVFETKQPGGNQTYKRMFGHPTGRFFDSILRFTEHFLWLMSGMEGDCSCVLCGKEERSFVPRARKPRDNAIRTRDLVFSSELGLRRPINLDESGGVSTRSSSAGGLASGREKRARGMGLSYPVDEEGTRDVYKECIQTLYKNRESRKGVKDDIIEEDSFDWEAEQVSLLQYLTRIDQQHSFVPRLGELVLWCKYFPVEHFLTKDTFTNEFKFYSFDTQIYLGFPDWRAGVITAVPNSSAVDGPIDFSDILDTPAKKTNLNSSSFRVETIPDANKHDKSASKQYAYLPLRNIRPLAHWQNLLKGFPQKRLHPSVYHGLSLMTTLSLLNKYEFRGDWPHGNLHCKGVYIGSELITVGDAVRIRGVSTPKENTSIDVLLVSSIRLNLHNISDLHADPQSALLCSETSVTLVGSLFSLDSKADYRFHDENPDQNISSTVDGPVPVDTDTAKHLFRPVGAVDYGHWYPVHSPHQRYEISHDQVIGRLYEANAVRLWTGVPQNAKPSLTFDLPGILSARKYATQTDQRIPLPPEDSPDAVMWHLADYRAQALAIASSNGMDVGPYDDVRTRRTLERWRASLRIRRGDHSVANLRDLGIGEKQRGRPPGSRVVDGKLVTGEVEGGDVSGENEFEAAGGLAAKKVKDLGTYTGKRRGRKRGTRVIDGKVVYVHVPPPQGSQGMKGAAREETESDASTSVDEDEEEAVKDEDGDMEMLRDDDAPRPGPELDGNSSFGAQKSLNHAEEDDEDEEGVDIGRLLQNFQRIDNPTGSSISDDSQDDNEVEENDSRRSTTSSLTARSRNENKAKTPLRPAPTKEQIMQSIEPGDFADDDNDDDDEDEEEDVDDTDEWWKTVPPARGGTEESSGGDYHPTKESQQDL